jgi:hypothetical protein
MPKQDKVGIKFDFELAGGEQADAPDCPSTLL